MASGGGVQSGGAPVQGFLTKQGKIMSNWKRRFFKLQGNKLYYYKSNLTSEKPLGYVLLDRSTSIQAYSVPPKSSSSSVSGISNNNRFSICSPGRTFYLVADTEAEMQKWVQKLNQTLSDLFGVPSSSVIASAASSPAPSSSASTSPVSPASPRSPRGADKSGLTSPMLGRNNVTSPTPSTASSSTPATSPATPAASSTSANLPPFQDIKAHILKESGIIQKLLADLTLASTSTNGRSTCESLKGKLSEFENQLQELREESNPPPSTPIPSPSPSPATSNPLSLAPSNPLSLSSTPPESTPPARTNTAEKVDNNFIAPRTSTIENQEPSRIAEAKPAALGQQQQQNRKVATDDDDLVIESGAQVRRLGKKQANDRKRNGIGNDLFNGPNPDLKRISARVLFQRERVEQEILESEKSYLSGLNSCVENFLGPIREAKEKDAVPINGEHINKIFTNIEVVIQVSSNLLKSLSDSRDTKGRTIGDVFVEAAPGIKQAYTEYVANYNDAISLLERLQQEQTPFSKFLKELQQNNMQSAGLTLESYLIMPVQRTPRYVMLLQELMKNTPVVHDDWDSIRLASVKMKEIAENINTAKTGREHLEKVIAIQKKLTGDFMNLADPNRKFVREGFLRKLWDNPQQIPGADGQSSTETYFFLFNDLLVYATPNKSQSAFFNNILAVADQLELRTQLQNESFHFEGFFLLEGCVLRDLPDTDETKHAFALTYKKPESNEVVISLAAYSADSKKKWMTDLEELVVQQQEGIKKSIESDASTECVKQGWLSKRGGKLKMVKRRWFKLQGHTLFYFPNEKTLTPLGSCNLLEFSIIPDKQEQKKNLACFRLYHPTKRNFWLYATTHFDMLEWILALKPLVLLVSDQFDLSELTSGSASLSPSGHTDQLTRNTSRSTVMGGPNLTVNA